MLGSGMEYGLNETYARLDGCSRGWRAAEHPAAAGAIG